MNGSTIALIDPTEEALSSSTLLGSLVGSVSSPRKANSEISKIYKQASTLFLTRRLAEAFSTIEPLITAPQSQEAKKDEEGVAVPAPIATASRSSRVKVWSLYLTLLNAIAELGPENGKAAFGSREWRTLVAKAQEGTIWEEVVKTGYGGIEGNVDADVVINLAILLLAQSTTQKQNQQYLESYLSASSQPSFDFTDRFGTSGGVNGQSEGKGSQSRGTDTPRDLTARVKIIELYTLHVLTRNGEWDYAREFIDMSEVLDEDVRESFLQALRTLETDENNGQDHFENALLQQNEKPENVRQPAEDMRTESVETMRQSPPPILYRSNSERDYGIDKARPSPDPPKARSPSPKSKSKPAKAIHPRSSRMPPTRSSGKSVNGNIYNRSVVILSALQHHIQNMTERMSQSPMSLLKFVLFLTGLVLAFSRRDVKERVGRLTGAGWEKLKETVGMGLKVSYI